MPQIESLNLFRSEENQEEIDLRKQLGLGEREREVTPEQTLGDSTLQVSSLSVPETAVTNEHPKLLPTSTEPPPQPSNWSQPPIPIWQPQATPVANPSILAHAAASEISVSAISTEPLVPMVAVPTSSRAFAPPDDDDDEEMPTIDMDSDSD
jgi:hypothetical protein